MFSQQRVKLLGVIGAAITGVAIALQGDVQTGVGIVLASLGSATVNK